MAARPEIDATDRALLRLLAHDATLSLADLAQSVGLTPTPCWKRIRRMETAGIITGRVALIEQSRVGLPVSVFVAVETADHSAEWLDRFATIVRDQQEIVGAWRMSGDADYMLHVIVPDIASYDAFYRRLIGLLPLRNVTSRFAIEKLKIAPLPL